MIVANSYVMDKFSNSLTLFRVGRGGVQYAVCTVHSQRREGLCSHMEPFHGAVCDSNLYLYYGSLTLFRGGRGGMHYKVCAVHSQRREGLYSHMEPFHGALCDSNLYLYYGSLTLFRGGRGWLHTWITIMDHKEMLALK